MGDFYIEYRSVPHNSSLSWDIAHHLYTRLLTGKAAIITKSPEGLKNAVAKQWHKVKGQVRVQRASIRNVGRGGELTRHLEHFESLSFSVLSPEAEVYFASADQFRQTDGLLTLYLTYEIGNKELRRITRGLMHHGLVVIYV